MHESVDKILALMASAWRLPLSRKRNNTDDSLTISRLRPDYMLLLRDVLLFKIEDKAAGHTLQEASEDLLSKMKDWSEALHGQVCILSSACCCI